MVTMVLAMVDMEGMVDGEDMVDTPEMVLAMVDMVGTGEERRGMLMPNQLLMLNPMLTLMLMPTMVTMVLAMVDMEVMLDMEDMADMVLGMVDTMDMAVDGRLWRMGRIWWPLQTLWLWILGKEISAIPPRSGRGSGTLCERISGPCP